MEIEVVGRHALLFDDDAMAAFVNSSDALVEWNSIPIDRYDVRHLLSSPPPPRRRHHHIVDSLQSDLDHERYLDLSLHQQELDDDLKPFDAGGYNAVAFSYGNSEDSDIHKKSDSGLESSAFHPPFPVPVDLVIPPTEKLHQIIARTAIYVSKQGAQTEIVLRVKQGDNPTFGFLMPHHHLHSYFRFLVDHSDILHSDTGEKSHNDKISDTEPGVGGGALSLLGSLYGFGEDDDGAVEDALTSGEKASDKAINTHVSEKTVSSQSISNDAVSNHPVKSQDKVPAKPIDKVFMLKRNSFTSGLKAGTGSGTRKEGESVVSHSATMEKSRSSSMAPTLMIEPPSEMKKMIAKIVEFIMKNGKQFEAVLIEQDSEHGRFPFLLPLSQYHQYYLKVLQEAQKSKVSGRSSFDEKDGLGLHGSSKKTIVSKGIGLSSLESAECEIPFDSDRKEKFKMVIGKSKNDGLDPPSKANQQQSEVGVDAAAAAAILQAATRGIRTTNLDFLSRSSLIRKDNSSEHVCSLGSRPSSQPQSLFQKSDQNGERCSVPVVKEIAKTAALEAAGEANSQEAHLTREQKLKAERLRRAKMFVAMMKSGSATQIKPESSRGNSLEPCHVGGAYAKDSRAANGREGSSVPLEIDATKNIESSKNSIFTDEYNERKARRKYRSNSTKPDAARDDTDDEEDEVVHEHPRKRHRKEENGVDEKEIKHPRRQHSHRASDNVSEQEDHSGKYHRYSRNRHGSHRSSHDGDDNDEVEHHDGRDRKYSRKHYRSYKSSEDDDEEERKHHRFRRSSHDRGEKDEVKHDDERGHKYSRKHHRSYKSSNDEDEEEHEDRRSRKKHRSHQSSHRSRHHSSRDSQGHKHRKRHTSSKDKESRWRSRHSITSEEENVHGIGSDELNGKVPRSEREDLEEGEISAKVSDQSRGSVGGAHREPSVDVSSSFQGQRSLSQPLEPTEVSNDLRAKIRAMLLETL